MVVYEYIWLGGNSEFRSKVKVSDSEPTIWNYDGSSTNQASTVDSEVLLVPVKTVKSPFKSDYLVLCETRLPSGKPHPTNTRQLANEIFKNDKNDSMFGIEHEFFALHANNKPIHVQDPDGSDKSDFYCGVGHGKSYGRPYLEEVFESCLTAGLNVTGYNMEVAAGQMEIQVCAKGIDAADQSMLLKYIIHRVAEKYKYIITFDAKPRFTVDCNLNGSGCHVNFSTKRMRQEECYDHIMDFINNLQNGHEETMKLYGDDNKKRLSGTHETSEFNKFTFGVGNRCASIRIPNETFKNKRGYIEDRRPSSSADMYIVTSHLLSNYPKVDSLR